MRLYPCLLLVLCWLSLSQAQLSFGPNGVSSSPINLVKVFGFLRQAWHHMMGTKETTEQQTKDTVKISKAEGRTGEDIKYNLALEKLKSRIQAASDAAAKLSSPTSDSEVVRKRGEKISTLRGDTQETSHEDPLLRSILLPAKKQVVVGKWPWVYGVLNGLLLAAALVLAYPYFVDGETIVTTYEDEKLYGGYGYGVPHHYAGGYGGGRGHYRHHSVEEPVYGGHTELLPVYSPPLPQGDTHHKREALPQRGEQKREEEPPLNELFYYNPTIFTSNEASSYGCLEKMVCLNPSRTARTLAQSSASKMLSRSERSTDGANWANVMRRLDIAAQEGAANRESCAKFYCPPSLPDTQENGDDYIPPPSAVRKLKPSSSSGRLTVPSEPPRRRKKKTPASARRRSYPRVAVQEPVDRAGAAVLPSRAPANEAQQPEPEPEPESEPTAEPEP